MRECENSRDNPRNVRAKRLTSPVALHYRTLARPRAVFFDFAVAGDSDHMPSSGQKLELHLQVAVLLPDAIPLILLGAVDFRGQKPEIIQNGLGAESLVARQSAYSSAIFATANRTRHGTRAVGSALPRYAAEADN